MSKLIIEIPTGDYCFMAMPNEYESCKYWDGRHDYCTIFKSGLQYVLDDNGNYAEKCEKCKENSF